MRAEIAILASDKIDFKTKFVTRNKTIYLSFIMIKRVNTSRRHKNYIQI